MDNTRITCMSRVLLSSRPNWNTCCYFSDYMYYEKVRAKTKLGFCSVTISRYMHVCGEHKRNRETNTGI